MIPGRMTAWSAVALALMMAVGGAVLGAVTAPSSGLSAPVLPSSTPARARPAANAFPPIATVAPNPPGPPDPPPPGPVTVNAVAWRGHGDLAFVSSGHVEVLSDAGTLVAITGPTDGGYDSDPAWSPDGRWLAFLDTGPANGFDVPAPTLWLVESGSPRAQAVTAAGIGMFAWAPSGSLLAYTEVPVDNGGRPEPDDLWIDHPGSSPASVAVGTDNGIDGIAWSPDGRQLAFDDAVYAQAATASSPVTPAVSRVGIVSPAGGPVSTGFQMTGAGIRLGAWWPSGGGLLFWEDPGFADAADGETLYSVAIGGHQPVALATSLMGAIWLTPEPGSDSVAVVAGGNFRDIRTPGRDVDLCRFPAATCQPVPLPSATVGLAPNWSASGTLVFAVAPASPPFGPNPSYTEGWMARWNAANALWAMAPGGQPVPLSSAAAGALLAVPAIEGTTMVVVADDALWLAGSGPDEGAVRVAGPLYSTIGPTGFYGEVDWSGTFAWSEGSGLRQGSTQLLDEGFFPSDPQLP